MTNIEMLFLIVGYACLAAAFFSVLAFFGELWEESKRNKPIATMKKEKLK